MNGDAPARFHYQRILLTGVLLTCAGIGLSVVVWQTLRQSSQSPHLVWNVPEESISKSTAESIQQGLARLPTSSFIPDDAYYEINTAAIDDNFAVLNGYAKSLEDDSSLGPGFVLLLINTSGEWRPLLQSDDEFCKTLERIPGTLMDPVDKEYFSQCF